MNAIRFVALLALLSGTLAVPAAAPPAIDRGDPLPPGALMRLGVARLRHPTSICCLSLSADGRTIASADQNGQVRLWDAECGRLLLVLPEDTGTCVALSSDGRTFVTAASLEHRGRREQPVCLWDARTGKRLRVFAELIGSRVAFAPDGKTLAGIDLQGRITLCEADTGRIVRRLGSVMSSAPTQLAFSHDGKALAAGNQPWVNQRYQLFAVWDVATGKERCRLDFGQERAIHDLAFSPDGRTLATAESGHVRLWDAHDGKRLAQLDRAGRFVSFDASGERLLSGDVLGVWDVKARKTILLLNPEERGYFRAQHAVISLDGKRVVSTHDNVIRIHDVGTGKMRPIGPGHRDEVRGVAWSRDGRHIATGSGGDGTFRLWDASSGNLSRVFTTTQGGRFLDRERDLSVLAFSTSGRSLVTPGERWSLAGTSGPITLPVERICAYSTDGKRFATYEGRDDVVKVQDEAGRTLHRLRPVKEHVFSVTSLAFSPDGRLLSVAYFDLEHQAETVDHTVQLWDASTGKLLRGLRPGVRRRSPHGAAFSPDGKVLATVTWGHPPQLFDVATGRELVRLTADHDARDWLSIQTLAFSPDGALLATNSSKGGIVIWETASGKVVRLLAGHDGGTRSLAFSPDGKRLLSGGADTTALVWEVVPTGGESFERGAWNRDTPAKLWDDLAKDPAVAYPALWSLLAHPESAIVLLEKRLQPDRVFDHKRIGRLIANLGDDDFDVRRKADEELRACGEQAEEALRKTLPITRDPEMRKRIAVLLARLEAPPSAAELRERRAIQALESMATPSAEALLETLAQGGHGGRKTTAAVAALDRLEARRRREAAQQRTTSPLRRPIERLFAR